MKHIKRGTAFHGKRIIISRLAHSGPKSYRVFRETAARLHVFHRALEMANVSPLRKLTERRKLEVARLLTRNSPRAGHFSSNRPVSPFLTIFCPIYFEKPTITPSHEDNNFFYHINHLHIRVDP